MANARRGLYIRVGYSVFRDGIPEDLASVTALTVIFRHICQPNSSVMYTGEKLSTYANTISATITDADQVKLMSGDYKIEVYYRRANPANESGYEPYVIDAPVFTLTDTSTEVNETTCGDITIQTINLAGEVSFCSEELEALILESKQAITDAEAATQAAIDAASAAMAVVDSKIDIDGLNSNIRQLKFNTATPVAPTQAGQMAWSDEEGTLALHNGLHTHPIGKETFFTAKNQSGTLIANGKAVYAIGSTGANATIGLATTANGDIAQRTIGIATMDIASNGFGDVTTFGEVNDINTSALTEGALVYLGLNGNLTSVEPVAPTPKISLGLCIRSHLTQGRIAVYVRPIARLNKLTDVYAPNLLDGDVLRWNGAALRYEVYNLVNKADLVGGKVPASQLPAYVDDILEYATFAAFPLVGETSKLYVTLDTNLTYRWSGSAYTEVSKSLAIGITSTTAFRGDWGKIAYDHSQLTNSNPHGTTAAQIANTPAGTIAATTVQAAINELDADRVQLETDLNLDEYTIAEAFNLLYRKIVSLETIIDSGVFKNLQVDNLTTVNAFNYNGAPLIVIGSTAPTSAPDFVGQTYVNTTAPGIVYSAKGVLSVSDWKQTSN